MKLSKYTVLAAVKATFPRVDTDKVRQAFDAYLGRVAQGEKGKETWSVSLREATKKSGVNVKATESRSGTSGLTADAQAFAWSLRAAEAAEADLGSVAPSKTVSDWFAKMETAPTPTPPQQQQQ